MPKISSTVSLSHLIGFRFIVFNVGMYTISEACCQSFKCIEDDYGMKFCLCGFCDIIFFKLLECHLCLISSRPVVFQFYETPSLAF